MTDTVTQAKREAAMLREIANSEARGVDWSTNLNASADFLEGIAHQPDSALVEKLRAALKVGEWFLNKCISAWSCGEPEHRVRDMLDAADDFRATLNKLTALGGSNAD